MKIIEFFGLPGSGKSTLCKEIIQQMGEGRRIYTYQDITRAVSTRKRRIPYSILVHMNPFRWKYIYLLRRFCKQYESVSKQAIRVLIALYDISSLIRVFSKTGIVILDEGFVQNLTSIAHLHAVAANDRLKVLVEYIQHHLDIFVVECRVDEEAVISRLRARGRKDRFNTIQQHADLCNALRIKKDNLAIVAKQFGRFECVDLNVPTAVAARQFFEEIYKTRE